MGKVLNFSETWDCPDRYEFLKIDCPFVWPPEFEFSSPDVLKVLNLELIVWDGFRELEEKNEENIEDWKLLGDTEVSFSRIGGANGGSGSVVWELQTRASSSSQHSSASDRPQIIDKSWTIPSTPSKISISESAGALKLRV